MPSPAGEGGDEGVNKNIGNYSACFVIPTLSEAEGEES